MRPGAALGVASMLAWGAAYVPSAWLVETWPPITAAGARLALAGVMLLAVLAALGRPLRPAVGPMAVGWLALTQTVLYYGAVFWGIERAGAGLPAVLANIDPLFVAVLAAAFLGETLVGPPVARPRRRPGGGGGGGVGGAAVAAGGVPRAPWSWWAGRSPGASGRWPPPAGCGGGRSRSPSPAGR